MGQTGGQIGSNSVFNTGSVEGVAVSGTTTYYSNPSDARSIPWASYDLYWGANVGTFTVQVSNKAAPVPANDNDWKTLALVVPMTQPSGSNTGDTIDLTDLPFRWVRLKYVNASGTGTILAYLQGKGG